MAAVLASAAVGLWPFRPAEARRRLRQLRQAAATGRRGPDPPARPRRDSRRAAQAGPLTAAALAGAAVILLVGGVTGLVLGPIVGFALQRGLSRLEPAAVRRRRTTVRLSLPGAAELLAACLTAGTTLEAATMAVARAVGGPLGEDLDSVLRSVQLGSPPVQAWTAAALDPELAPLATALARASRGGAPPAEVLNDAAQDLRDRRRADGSAAAQRVGVHVVAPLALCFLPAFVLLGIVPLVLGLVEQLFRASW